MQNYCLLHLNFHKFSSDLNYKVDYWLWLYQNHPRKTKDTSIHKPAKYKKSELEKTLQSSKNTIKIQQACIEKCHINKLTVIVMKGSALNFLGYKNWKQKYYNDTRGNCSETLNVENNL